MIKSKQWPNWQIDQLEFLTHFPLPHSNLTCRVQVIFAQQNIHTAPEASAAMRALSLSSK